MRQPRFFESAADFRKWLAKNHEKESELLLGFYKTRSKRGGVTYAGALDEALAFGWIDGVRKNFDEESYTIRFSPRKPKSIWSAINIERVGLLTERGTMMPAGLRVFEERDLRRAKIYSYERDTTLELDPLFEKKLKASKRGWTHFQAQPPWYRRVASFWVMSAKKAETRERRFETLLACSVAGEKVPPLSYGPKREKRKPG